MILIEKLDSPRVRDVEVVERKGIGHPDTLADGIAEELSREYCLYFLNKELPIPRYFFDKVYIYGGTSEKYFGGGRLKQPFKVIIPSMIPGDNKGFIEEVTLSYLEYVLHEFSREYGKVHPIIYETNEKFYDNEEASDSSIATGYYPLSEIEEIVLETEQYLNKGIKIPFLGEDIKILATRDRERADFTFHCSFISRHIKNKNDYLDKKRKIEDEVNEFISERYQGKFTLSINPDDENKTYLSFLGSCIDSFAVGVSGKGNSINGLSSLYRPKSQEGVFGKNIVRHPGRVYNLLSFLIAKKLSEEFSLRECYVHMVGRIGDNITSPSRIIIESPDKLDEEKTQEKCNYIINNLDEIRMMTLKYNICEDPRSLLKLNI